MPLMQPKLSLKVAQRQILTPGLMQMVSVLALNKVELKEMIDAEMVENPVLEEIDESVPMLDEVAGREEKLARGAEEPPAPPKDSFEEVDFGSYFQDYLDPGYRTQVEFDQNEKPSFENFLSQPTTLSDHLAWQLGALTLEPLLQDAAEFVIGNLDDDGYLASTEEELAAVLSQSTEEQSLPEGGEQAAALALLRRGIDLVQHLDPAGVGARDLRECLLIQIAAQQHEFAQVYARQAADAVDSDEDPHRSFRAEADARLEERRRSMEVAVLIVDRHLQLLQKRDVKDLARAAQVSTTEADAGVEFIRTLDPRPGRQYNREQTRLIEPDVVFVKRGGEWAVSMNEEDMPSLRLSSRYRRMLAAEGTDKEVKDYVKERFRSAMQLMRNIAQRKSTILRTCEVIVRRQQDFLDRGVEAMRPLMIKEVAEEIGVHPSTVSRAVANKYAHTPQGVIELRYFFSEGSNGPEGADTTLLVLKRKVRKLIEDEDASHPLTDDQLAALLGAQGIQLTHQRRRRDG
jgi:RNA polymerase sigma-54 factor